MDYYRCENPDCGFLAGEEPDICPRCGGTFFTPLLEEDLSGGDWVWLGNQAVDEKRDTDALACYQRAAALGDDAGLTNLGWCLEAGIGVSAADPKQAVVLYAQVAALCRRKRALPGRSITWPGAASMVRACQRTRKRLFGFTRLRQSSSMKTRRSRPAVCSGAGKKEAFSGEFSEDERIGKKEIFF